MVPSGHVPATPANVEWTAVIRRIRGTVRRQSILLRIHAANEPAWNVHRRFGRVTLHAIDVVSFELGFADISTRLRQRIEHRSQRWILRRELDEVAAANPADRHPIVEIDGPWVLWADPGRLEAGLREHERL